MVLDATGEDDLEYLKEEPANLREQYNYVLQNVPESVVEKDMVSSSGKKVVFLTDDNNNVCFNSSLITQNASVLDKLSKGLFDYKRGKKPSYIKGVRNTDYLVRINVSGNDCCSFIELPNNIVLVVTIGTYEDVIDNSIQLANKYDSKIENFREMALNDSELLVTMNDSIVNLSSGDGRKG